MTMTPGSSAIGKKSRLSVFSRSAGRGRW